MIRKCYGKQKKGKIFLLNLMITRYKQTKERGKKKSKSVGKQ